MAKDDFDVLTFDEDGDKPVIGQFQNSAGAVLYMSLVQEKYKMCIRRSGKAKEVHHYEDVKAVNFNDDRQQYKEYMSVLGEERMPETLALFQEMKYNDVDKYEQLKDHVYIQRNFNNGTWKDAVNPEKQARHMQSTAPQDKSYFYDWVDVEELYRQHKMTSGFRIQNGIRQKNYELIDINPEEKIGLDAYSGESINGFTIHYSKTGAHLIPTYHKE